MLCHQIEDVTKEEGINPEKQQFGENEQNTYNISDRRINFLNSPNRRSIYRFRGNDNNPISLDVNSGRRYINDLTEMINELHKMEESPVDESILKILPESKIKNIDKLPQDKRNCVICMDDYKENELVLTIPCYHIFHKNCIKEWFKKDKTCPICKFVLNKKNLNLK